MPVKKAYKLLVHTLLVVVFLPVYLSVLRNDLKRAVICRF